MITPRRIGYRDYFMKTAGVIIIGGGIMGLSTAYHLALRGVEDIVVLEKDLLAQATTGLSVGGIRQQFSLPANIRLSQESLRMFENFEEEFDTDIHFRQVGYLFLARTEETWRDFLSSVRTQRHLDVPVEVLTPEEIQHRWPYLNTKDIRGGTFGPKDGYADPYLVAMGFTRAARRFGVQMKEKTRVTTIVVESGKFKKVDTTEGSVSAPIAVIAAGPWAGEVGRMAGVELPVKPFRRQVFMTKPFDGIPKPVPMIIDQDAAFYFRGEDPGLLMGMSDQSEPSSFNLNVDRRFMENVVEAAIHRAPVLGEAEILRGWAGLYEVTPDDNPVIGPLSPVQGLYAIAGFSGHGFQHGPSAGRILSELIIEGRTEFDFAPFAFERFQEKNLRIEKRIV